MVVLRIIIACCVLSLFAGCEARLNMQGVDETREQAVLRTDSFLSMEKLPNKRIVAFGYHGVVLTSDDAGEHWQRTELSGLPNFIASSQCPDGSLLGLAYGQQLWVSSNQAEDWRSITLTAEDGFEGQDVACDEQGNYWVVGSFSTILKSVDQGSHWQVIALEQDANLTVIDVVDENHIYVSGEFGLFVVSADAGQTWNVGGTILDEIYPLGMHFADRMNGWVSSLSGVVLQTQDAGKSWQRVETGTVASLFSFVETDKGLYLLGDNNTILKHQSTKGWLKQPSRSIPLFLRAGAVLDNGDLLVAGGGGVIYNQATYRNLTVTE